MRLIDADALFKRITSTFDCVPIDVLEMIEEAPTVTASYEDGEYDVLDLLSSAWYGKRYYSPWDGKQYYFRERNGMIYSRATCQYMTLDDAITEFANRLGDDGSI